MKIENRTENELHVEFQVVGGNGKENVSEIVLQPASVIETKFKDTIICMSVNDLGWKCVLPTTSKSPLVVQDDGIYHEERKLPNLVAKKPIWKIALIAGLVFIVLVLVVMFLSR